VDWIDLARDRDKWQTFAKMVLNLRVPQSAVKLLTSRETPSFYRMILSNLLLRPPSKAQVSSSAL
jgi:hypothetical protein